VLSANATKAFQIRLFQQQFPESRPCFVTPCNALRDYIRTIAIVTTKKVATESPWGGIHVNKSKAIPRLETVPAKTASKSIISVLPLALGVLFSGYNTFTESKRIHATSSYRYADLARDLLESMHASD
jgi:hypothetical protein